MERREEEEEMLREQDLLLLKRRLLHCSVSVADRLERGSTAWITGAVRVYACDSPIEVLRH